MALDKKPVDTSKKCVRNLYNIFKLSEASTRSPGIVYYKTCMEFLPNSKIAGVCVKGAGGGGVYF